MGLLDQFLEPQPQMAGQGLLAQVFSQGDRAKRYLRGLLADPTGTIARTAGQLSDNRREVMGLADKAMAGDAKAAGDAGEMALASLLGFAPAGITAWHGSPHIFNKFDSSKIGTGEGAQAYGHGLYLAESPEVAQSYVRSAGSEYKRNIAYLRGQELDNQRGSLAVAVRRLAGAGDNFEKVKADTIDWLKTPLKVMDDPASRARAIDAINGANKSDFVVKDNYLYKVDLPDDAVARMLDWDKPLSQQAPEVQQLLPKLTTWQQEMMNEPKLHAGWKNKFGPGNTGAVAYGDLMRERGGAAVAAEQLRSMGIPGIRYLDGGSRGAGQGSSNFVIFPGEENLLTILERNGVPLGR